MSSAVADLDATGRLDAVQKFLFLRDQYPRGDPMEILSEDPIFVKCYHLIGCTREELDKTPEGREIDDDDITFAFEMIFAKAIEVGIIPYRAGSIGTEHIDLDGMCAPYFRTYFRDGVPYPHRHMKWAGR